MEPKIQVVSLGHEGSSSRQAGFLVPTYVAKGADFTGRNLRPLA